MSNTIYMLLEQTQQSFNPNMFIPTEEESSNAYFPMSYEGPPEDATLGCTLETNPFTGGEIQRQAHLNGSYDHIDYHELALKSWKNKEERLDACIPKMTEGYQKWMKNNKDYFLDMQRTKLELAHQAKRIKQQKLLWHDTLYYGWSELARATGKTKYFLKKDPEVITL